MPTVTTYTGYASIEVPRLCGQCGQEWVFQSSVTTTSSGMDVFLIQTASPDEADSAAKTLSKEIEAAGADGILCPTCGHFATCVIEHLFPNGFRSRRTQLIVQRAKLQLKWLLIGCVIIGVAPILFWPLSLSGVKNDASDVAAVCTGGLVLLGILVLAYNIWVVNMCRRLRRVAQGALANEDAAREWFERIALVTPWPELAQFPHSRYFLGKPGTNYTPMGDVIPRGSLGEISLLELWETRPGQVVHRAPMTEEEWLQDREAGRL